MLLGICGVWQQDLLMCLLTLPGGSLSLQVKLAEFLALMPSEDLEAANQQVAAFATMF